MMKINRLLIKITATNKTYTFDKEFKTGLNLIASDDNTKGKSSILAGIYYALGFEEIIGGINEKVLTSVYKTKIQDEKRSWNVLSSAVYLEINNGNDTVTLYRSAKDERRDTRLVTVFFSGINMINDDGTGFEDYYVHMPNAATNEKGFHTFLEKFIGAELPMVPASDGKDRKLYLQLVFAALFIEQKKGWSSIYAGIPYLGIRDPKKRVTEYLLNLHTFENERKRSEILNRERYQTERWTSMYKLLLVEEAKAQCRVDTIPSKPEILPSNFVEKTIIKRSVGKEISIDDWIKELEREHEILETKRPRIVDNYEQLQTELQSVEAELADIDTEEKDLCAELSGCRRKVKTAQDNLWILNNDIKNNKDAKRLQDLGSDKEIEVFGEKCPVCGQKIHDSLLPIQHDTFVMSFDESINHLKAQKEMIVFWASHYKERIKKLEEAIESLRSRKITLLRLAKSLRRDVYSVDDDYSETIIYKRIEIERHIEILNEFKIQINSVLNDFVKASNEWNDLQKEKSMLPQEVCDQDDINTIREFKDRFVENLKAYNYTSVDNLLNIDISKDNYMPVIDDFDMKFDSSASDNIRAIWAYTMALAQTSKTVKANWPGIMIFDEPGQHSIGAEDMKSFFINSINMANEEQIIVGITLNSEDIKRVVDSLQNKINFIHIEDRAFA
ncbi:hypothetical protein SAMN02745229_00197 [Butyrivibrio fibrisolvens DSM 3071]|uniref:Nuclease SbcCD subunit C n=1 Tax=Butyrivibrio fibrisolvens DSM 3071 TaxID=1121131 RepID=A0A1M5Q4G3_BUTFI|nr:hypothetical protein [Butyrivibrio fibrisolvens]SHH09025.1 hypothetical protein SAMN02745229_00197 [Butyrivibrio fibrisolvens DSM 3071]